MASDFRPTKHSGIENGNIIRQSVLVGESVGARRGYRFGKEPVMQLSETTSYLSPSSSPNSPRISPIDVAAVHNPQSSNANVLRNSMLGQGLQET